MAYLQFEACSFQEPESGGWVGLEDCLHPLVSPRGMGLEVLVHLRPLCLVWVGLSGTRRFPSCALRRPPESKLMTH